MEATDLNVLQGGSKNYMPFRRCWLLDQMLK